MKLKPLLATLLALAASLVFAQNAYRWVGKDGKVHYSDAPPAPEETQKVEQKKFNASVIDSGGRLSYDARQAASNFPVTLYLAPECGPACKAAREFLAKRGIPYTEKVVATPDDTTAFRTATKSDMLPTLLVGSKVEKGFEGVAWDALLDAAGYPPAKQ